MKITGRPEFTQNYDDDKLVLDHFFQAKQKHLDPRHHLMAEKEWMDLKEVFLQYHSCHIYRLLTDDFNKYIRLSELVYQAGELIPCLLPSREEISAEEGLPLTEKAGYEIDQGLFLKTILNDPRCGSHLCDSMLRPEGRSMDLLPEFREKDQVKLKKLQIRRAGEVAHITFNNQAYLNAEDNQLISEMEIAVDLALLDDRVKVSVLRGGVMTHPRYQGKRVFSAGINLIHLSEGKISFIDFLLKREFGYISKIAHGLYIDKDNARLKKNIQKPWIAAVDSFAIGGGMQLLLVCDRVIGEKHSFISLPAAHEGIIPGVSAFRLPRLINGRLTRQIILAGKKITANSQDGHLFFDEVVDDELMDESIESACREMNNPAVVENRKILSHAIDSKDDFRKYMAHFTYAQARCMFSEMIQKNVGKFIRRKLNVNKQERTEELDS